MLSLFVPAHIGSRTKFSRRNTGTHICNEAAYWNTIRNDSGAERVAQWLSIRGGHHEAYCNCGGGACGDRLRFGGGKCRRVQCWAPRGLCRPEPSSLLAASSSLA